MSKNNNEIKHEDLIMKKAMDVFAEEGLKFFGINQKVKDSSSTEIVVLEALNLHIIMYPIRWTIQEKGIA